MDNVKITYCIHVCISYLRKVYYIFADKDKGERCSKKLDGICRPCTRVRLNSILK